LPSHQLPALAGYGIKSQIHSNAVRTPDQALPTTDLPVARLTITASPAIRRVPAMNRARPTTKTAMGNGRTSETSIRMPPHRVMVKAVAKPRSILVLDILVSMAAF
jgi:hypothetical protein